jgi:hypothetical protein
MTSHLNSLTLLQRSMLPLLAWLSHGPKGSGRSYLQAVFSIYAASRTPNLPVPLWDHAGNHRALARQVWALLTPDERTRAEILHGKHGVPALVVYGALTLDPPPAITAQNAETESEEHYTAVSYETLPEAPQDGPGEEWRSRIEVWQEDFQRPDWLDAMWGE